MCTTARKQDKKKTKLANMTDTEKIKAASQAKTFIIVKQKDLRQLQLNTMKIKKK